MQAVAEIQDRLAGSMIGGMSEVRLEFHLDNWRRFMRSDVIVDGYPGRTPGCVAGGISASFDELVDSADRRCAEAVDALMLGLNPAERVAINHVYLSAVFRFPRHNLPVLLQSGRFKIARGLVSRGFY